MPLTHLNKEQAQAAKAQLGNNLVIASAGTGKTSCIVGRISHLLSQGIAPQEIILLTFTNKASKEMIERLKATTPHANLIRSGTFHGLCYEILRGLDPSIKLKLPRELRLLFASIFESHTNKPLSLQAVGLFEYYELFQVDKSDDFGEFLDLKAPQHLEFLSVYESIIKDFDKQKRELNYLGFSDLILRLIEYVQKGYDIGVKEILVDEYQDTNALQNKLIEAINPRSLFCVGDYDQSIYGFNGAQISIIANFEKQHKDAHIFTLFRNYRSTKHILDLANRVISHNERLYDKKLVVCSKSLAKEPILLSYEDVYFQYEDIAQKIAHSQFSKNEIAVLFRNNSSADGIEAALAQQGIACKRKSGRSFFDLAEIKLLLDLLSLIVARADLLAFIGVFSQIKGIGLERSKKMFEAIMQGNKDSVSQAILQIKPRTKSLFHEDGFNPQDLGIKLPEQGNNALLDLYELAQKTHRTKSPYAILGEIISSKLYQKIINDLSKQDKTLEQKEKMQRILQNAQMLRKLSQSYKDALSFLATIVLSASEASAGEGVELLSVHASKGLEFSEVFIVDLMDKRFPNQKLISTSGSLEEERRLFYVAATRAKYSLFLSYAKANREKKMSFSPSQFLIEAGFEL